MNLVTEAFCVQCESREKNFGFGLPFIRKKCIIGSWPYVILEVA